MITRRRSRADRAGIIHDDNGSMILALLAIVILTSLLTVVLMVVVSQQVKTRKASDFTFAGQAADAAVNDALQLANQMSDLPWPLVDPETDVHHWVKEAPQVGGAGDFVWTWYSRLPQGAGVDALEIVATGCRNPNPGGAATVTACEGADSARTMKATLSGTVVDGVDKEPGKTAYMLTPAQGFGRALFADKDLILQGEPTKVTGQVATNGMATFSDTADLQDGVFLSNAQVAPASARCSVIDAGGVRAPCAQKVAPAVSTAVHDIRPKLQIDDTTFIDERIRDECTDQQLKPWVASESPLKGYLIFPPSGPLCFSSMNFDYTTTVGPTPFPQPVYVTGPVTVGSGVQVNTASSSASRLTIFSAGAVVNIGGGTPVAAQTKVVWALWAPQALCTTPSDGDVDMTGSMVCSKITTQGPFTATWDDGLAPTPPPGAPEIWDVSGYAECTNSGCQS